MNCIPLAEALVAAGWAASLVQTMIAIGAAESGCRLNAVNAGRHERSVGPLQINIMAHKEVPERCAKNYYCSARVALRIYKKQGFNAWTVFKTGAYRKYMRR